MKKWGYFKRLMLNKASLSRVLTEIELEHVYKTLFPSIQASKVLVAGGGLKSRGSEHVLLDLIDNKKSCLFADINRFRNPNIIADLGSIWSFRNEAFDLILSTWVIEHIISPTNFFIEAFRTLRRKGVFVCSVPFIQRQHGSPHDYYRFTDMSLSSLASSAGFKHIEIRPVGGKPFVCCISLLWPLFPFPLIGLILFSLAWISDVIYKAAAKMFGRKGEILNSYPINYILIGIK